MKKITADKIYPVSSEPLENTVIVIDDQGKILAFEPLEDHDPASVQRFDGALIPGFVNTHCHLELSHMKGLVDTGVGLIPFITNVVTKRNMAAEMIADAIRRAEEEMFLGGIMAVGDISNTTDTFEIKSTGRLRWYTFVELFDFLQENGAEKAFSDWKPVFDMLNPLPGSAKSLVPHAPYSVSRNLFAKIRAVQPEKEITISIHNQETLPENELFLSGTGAFFDFYSGFNISLEHFKSSGKTAIHYAIENLDPEQRTLFVHNTLTTREDLAAAHLWSDRVYWATCPNANLYIENRLPDYRVFLDGHARMTIGTDSLTSNWQLSVLEELKTISRYQSYVPTETLIQWATLNGAEALGFDDELGSLQVGKTPGILNLTNFTGRFDSRVEVKRVELERR